MTDITQRLRSTLAKWSINVSDGIFIKLKAEKNWIRETVRVDDMLEQICKDTLYEIFDYEHHFASAVELFESLGTRRPVAVVFGQKQQGKSQLLFFLVRLLQELDEMVLYLDKSILLILEGIDRASELLNFWDVKGLSDECKQKMNDFKSNRTTQNFVKFIEQLNTFAEGGNRVWVIVDEVVEFSKVKFPIVLPEEQTKSAFHWVVTGSAGIGSWVGKQHLEQRIFDLPLFSPQAATQFATSLCSHLGVNLCDKNGIIQDRGLPDWLDERFGGVIGYVAEFCFALKNPNDTPYLEQLRSRIKSLIKNAAKEAHTPLSNFCRSWLNEMNSPSNDWSFPRDAGLCGRGPPRGVIFTIMLKLLFEYDNDDSENLLAFVNKCRINFSRDPGLDGCLLELEEILKLKKGTKLEAARVVLVNDQWTSIRSAKVTVPQTKCRIWSYDDGDNALKISQDEGSNWNLIELCSGFDVVDVVLVDANIKSPKIYGIQITRSSDPFRKHHTMDTCSDSSKERLGKLWGVIKDRIGPLDYTIIYTMIAPNCEDDKFKAPANHVQPYYFSPANIVFDYLQENKPAAKRTKRV